MRSTIYLADTNVLSELFRPRPDAGVLAWAESVPLVCVSAVSVEEMFYGLALKPNSRIRERLEEFLASFCECLEVSEVIASRSGQLRGGLHSRGIARTQADMLVAATADVERLTLVTRNVRHFEECQIPLLNPFRDGD